MTEKEFDQIRNSYYGRYEKKEQPKEDSGYFAYFKLRCLICLILLFGIIILDRQIDLKSYDNVLQTMQILEKEELTVEECLNIIK